MKTTDKAIAAALAWHARIRRTMRARYRAGKCSYCGGSNQVKIGCVISAQRMASATDQGFKTRCCNDCAGNARVMIGGRYV